MTKVTVLAGFGSSAVAPSAAFTDITRWVDIVSSGISITRGASDELSETQTATCSLVLDDSDGRFTTGNTSSPYYPNVRRQTPLWVRVTTLTGANWLTNPSFEGNNLNDWSTGPTAPNLVALDNAHLRPGSTWAARIAWTNSGTGGSVQTTVYGLTIGQSYTASGYVYVATGSPAVRLVAGGVNGALSTTTAAFQRITVTWTATAASHTVALTTGTTSPGLGTTVWLDDVMVNTGAAAATYDGTPAQVSDRFYGPVASWPKKRRGLLTTAVLTAADLFSWLARLPALQPMLIEEVLHDGPAAYYPLGEADGATSAGDVSGNTCPSLVTTQVGAGGTLQFGQGTGPATDGLPTPLFTPASASAGKYLMTTLQAALVDPLGIGSYEFEAWFSTTTKGRVLLCWATTDTSAIEESITFLLDATTGHLVIERRVGGFLTTTTVGTPDLSDGGTHYLLYDEYSQIAYVDGTPYSVSVAFCSGLQVLTVGARAGARLWAGTISHVAIYVAENGVPFATDLVGHYTAGTTGWDGEDADDRMARLASYAGVTSLIATGTFSPVASQGQLGSNGLSHMRDVEKTEGGKLACDRGSPALRFQSRTTRYNPVSAFSLSYPDLETDDVDEADDDQKMVNIIVASRPGGATQRIVDRASLATYGPYQPTDLTLLKTSDNQILDAANWTILRYSQPYTEIRQVPVEAYTMPAATYQALLAADIGTVFTVIDLPADSAAAVQTLTVEGYTEAITERQHKINLRTSRTYTDAVWVLDDPVYSVLGTTTRLAY